MRKGIQIAAWILAAGMLGCCACEKTEHVHTYSDEWEYDEHYHWQVPTCGDTDAVGNKGIHNFVRGVCHLCGYSPNGNAQSSATYRVTYAVDGDGGSIEGEKTQTVKRGGSTSPVTAVPDEGYLFVMWNDGEIEPRRQETNVEKNLSILAIFQPDPDNPDIDDDEDFGNDHPEEEDDKTEKGKSEEENGLIFTEIKEITGEEVTGYSVRRSDRGNFDGKIPKEFRQKPVLEIEDSAFEGSNLTQIELPEGIVKIGHKAFMNCGSLREIVIPDTVEDVGNQAFQGCFSLQRAVLSSKMKGVWYKMFYRCSSLEEIALPDSVESVGRYAFYACSRLRKVSFGTGMRKCGAKAFQDCRALQEVHTADLKGWCETTYDYFMLALSSTFESNPLYYAQNLYYEGELVEDLVIPEGTALINSYAFINCKSIKSVKIPSSVKVIGCMVFMDCSNLQSVEFEEGLISIEYSIFMRCHSLKEIAFPDSLETMGFDPDALENVGSRVIESCSELVKITLGKNLKRVNDSICMGCPKLNQVDFRGTIEEWRNMERRASWISSCADDVTLRCLESKKDILYHMEWVVEGYLRFLRYEEVSVTDWN